MRYIELYRSDFKADAEADFFFDDILYSLGIPEKEWDNIDSVELKVEDYKITTKEIK